jgi:hypothetical protein
MFQEQPEARASRGKEEKRREPRRGGNRETWPDHGDLCEGSDNEWCLSRTVEEPNFCLRLPFWLQTKGPIETARDKWRGPAREKGWAGWRLWVVFEGESLGFPRDLIREMRHGKQELGIQR